MPLGGKRSIQIADELKSLEKVKSVDPKRKVSLVAEKLKLCNYVCDFASARDEDGQHREQKRRTLLEIVDYMHSCRDLGENFMGQVIDTVSHNIFRAFPPQLEDYDPDEDDPFLDPSWPHLQVVYEILLRFIVHPEVSGKLHTSIVSREFCSKIVELFKTEDPRERDYLKTILHRIYGKFMGLRSNIRRLISNTFAKFVYEPKRHPGIGELLEILGSIINGFALPLKKEHVNFLKNALLPLHESPWLMGYHQQLCYCVAQYVEKDAAMALPVMTSLLRSWPYHVSSKQVLYLNELEEIMELTAEPVVLKLAGPLFTCIARCVGSEHFQISERALFLWNNDHLTMNGCLNQNYSSLIIPVIYPVLLDIVENHWNATVQGLSDNVIKLLQAADDATCRRVAADANAIPVTRRKIETFSHHLDQLLEKV